MARLPAVNGDDGVWGQILNDYLLVSHKADGSEKSAGGLPPADPANLVINTSSYSNSYSGSGDYTTAVFDTPTAALAIAQSGDDFPQVIIGATGSTALAFGDGTLDPFSDGANIWTDGVPSGLSGANLTLTGSGTRLTLGQIDPADATNPTTTVWNDLQLTDLQQTVGVVFRARQGNPNGAHAGRQGDVVIDGNTPAVWQCVTSGDSSGAVWQQVGDDGNWPANWQGISSDTDAENGTIYEVFSDAVITLPDAEPGQIVGVFVPFAGPNVSVVGEGGLQVDGQSTFNLNGDDREIVMFIYAEGIGDAWYVLSHYPVAATTAREILDGNSVIVVAGSDALLTWDTKDSGDDMLDLTDPENPSVIEAGIYAVTLNVMPRENLTIGATYNATLDLDLNGQDAEAFADSPEATAANPNPGVSLSCTFYIPAGGVIQANVQSHDSADRQFSVAYSSVQRIS